MYDQIVFLYIAGQGKQQEKQAQASKLYVAFTLFLVVLQLIMLSHFLISVVMSSLFSSFFHFFDKIFGMFRTEVDSDAKDNTKGVRWLQE